MIRILNYEEVDRTEIFARTLPEVDVTPAVKEIIADVREHGDAALFSYTERFDGAKLSSLCVSEEEIARAVAAVPDKLIAILKRAAENISRFHKEQLNPGFEIRDGGILLGQKVTPVDRAGLYIPGGTAAYPSTVLMNAIPAKIAGVSDIVMVTPPNADGTISDVILAAAHVAGIDRIYKIGGAQAIAALAYGTDTVPRADVIVGPGNAYVAAAKREIFGAAGIDMIAGPSEILIVADGDNAPAVVAADLLSQAEHDKMASAVLVTDSAALASAVSEELERQIPLLSRSEIARVSIDTNGKIIVAPDIDVAVDIANEIAPEHLELCVADPIAMLQRIRHAGSVFLGRHTPEALGDYFAGPNHTLPTSGTARFSSPLSVDAFVKKTQYICYEEEDLLAAADDIAAFANAEGLTGHAESILIRTRSKS